MEGGSASHTPPADHWAILLEQASDFNDELHRENCELHREVELLRQRRRMRQEEGGSAPSSAARRAAKAAAMLPQCIAAVRHAFATELHPPPAGAEGLADAVEDAVRAVLREAAEAGRGEAAVASNEETAALINEKVALKEFAMRQQERILELELARGRLLSEAGAQGVGHWASRLTSALPGVSLADVSAALSSLEQRAHAAAAEPGAAPAPAAAEVAAAPPIAEPSVASASMVAVGQECEVVGKKGAMLRSSEALDSDHVATLPPSARVVILELGAPGSRRAKVQAILPPADVAKEAAGGAGPVDAAVEAPALAEASAEAQAPSEATAPPDAATAEGQAMDAAVESAAAPAEAAAGVAAAAAGPAADAGAEAAVGAIGWLSVVTKDGRSLVRAIEPPQVEEACASEEDAGRGPDDAARGPDDAAKGADDAAAVAEAAPAAATEEVEAPESDKPVFAPDGSVILSTSAWLAIRRERTQREKQIKALQGQVDTARRELEDLAKVRAQLREQRAALLEVRRRGNELQEIAWMAEEERLVIRNEALEWEAAEREREAAEREAAERAAAAAAAEAAAREAEGAGGPSDEDWERLLSEREAAAQELSRVLGRVEQMESELEERRIQIQIAARRRERERAGLLTAYRELRRKMGASDHDIEAEIATDEDTIALGGISDGAAASGPEGPEARGADSDAGAAALGSAGGSDAEGEREYLAKIAALEDTAAQLQAQLDEVQAREAALNRSAVTRGAALRSAASSLSSPGAHGAGDLKAEVEAALLASEAGEDLSDLGRSGNAELDGLMDMLDRLFVENFALRGGSSASSAVPSRPAASRVVSSSLLPAAAREDAAKAAAAALNLSRFAVDLGGASDEEDSPRQEARPAPPPRPPEPSWDAAAPPHPAPPRLGGAWGAAAAADPSLSPRSQLLSGLDLSRVAVTE